MWNRLLLLAVLLCVSHTAFALVKTTLATCVLSSTPYADSTISGTYTFSDSGSGLFVSYSVCGLTAGTHKHEIRKWGDIFSNVGGATGTKAYDFRTGTTTITAVAGQCASLQDTQTTTTFALGGSTSVVGRSVVVYGNSTDSNAIVAQCVIGRKTETATGGANPTPAPTAASCVFAAPLHGYMTFERLATNSHRVRYFVHGLNPNRSHPVYINQYGDLNDAVNGGVFVGVNAGRLVGQIGLNVQSLNTVGSGAFTDTVLTLTNDNSIIGRSVIVYSGFDSTVQLGKCVIGITSETTATFPAVVGGTVPLVTRANAVLGNVQPNPVIGAPDSNIYGLVDFQLQSGSNTNIIVRYTITGLSPGDHVLQIRTLGDLCAGKASAVGAVFASLNNGVPVVADSYGVAQGQFTDSGIALYGDNSILGRAVAVLGNGNATDPSGATTVVGHAVVGRVTESATVLATEATSTVYSASCRFRPTLQATLIDSFDGYVQFDTTAGGVQVKVAVSGLDAGRHGWQLATSGDAIGLGDGQPLGSVFTGQPLYPRPVGQPQAVGQINDGAWLFADANNYAYTAFRDRNLVFSGNNSIIGRALYLLQGNNTSSTIRVAQCVIGITNEAIVPAPACSQLNENRFVPMSQVATCFLRPTQFGNSSLSGTVTFTRQSEWSQTITVSWNVVGLKPGGNHAFHVHEFGDIWGSNGLTVAGHFIGDCGGNCRSVGKLQEVGLIGDGAVMAADGTGTAVGSLNDTVLRLNGVNSIIGRSVIIHDSTTPTTRVAQCVIGRSDVEATETAAALADDAPLQTRAQCVFAPINGINAGGYATFELVNGSSASPDGEKVEMRVFVWGALGDGEHGIHVHVTGDVSDTVAGNAVLGHYIGPACASSCRPTSLQEVGNIGNGYTVKVKDNVGTGFVVDSVIKLNGKNSVMGRSIVVHLNPTGGPRQLQCVIGLRQGAPVVPRKYAAAAGTVQYITRATAVLTNSNTGVPTGIVDFDHDPVTDRRLVRYIVAGLTPGTHEWNIRLLGAQCNNSNPSSGVFAGDSCASCAASANVGSLVRLGTFTADANGVAQGYASDAGVAFNSTNSIIGRLVAVHDSDINSVVVTQGVIGRARETTQYLMPPQPYVQYAACRLQPTLAAPNQNLNGYVTFQADDVYGRTLVEYQISGLPAGGHGWHVHVYGDISARDDGTATTGHYIGVLDTPRPNGALQEVGNMNDGIKLFATSSGDAIGRFSDSYIRLNGFNSIIGRSLIVHGNGTDGAIRIAQCVIGLTSEVAGGAAPACPSQITPDPEAAIATLVPTTFNADQGLYGSVSLIRVGTNVVVSYLICGLSSGAHAVEVRTYGDVLLNTGESSGPVYVGSKPGNQNVGDLAQNVQNSGSTNCTQGAFTSSIIALRGDDSVVGRTFVVLSNTNEGVGKVVAHGVIGRDDNRWDLAPTGAAPTRLTCSFRETTNALNPNLGIGYVEDNGDASVTFKMFVGPIRAIVPHDTHVHNKGNLARADGSNVEGHFIGDCNGCRPAGLPQETGLIGSGQTIRSAAGAGGIEFVDKVVTLKGNNSIVGRALLLHGSASSVGPPVTMCVLGIAREGTPVMPPAISGTVPRATAAACYLQPTSNSPIGSETAGYVTFEATSTDESLVVTYHVYGLPSGANSWAITQNGNLCGSDGSTVGGTFVGQCSSCRGGAVGAMTPNNLTADSNGFAVGRYTDSVFRLYSDNSIIGRSLVVYSGLTSTVLAQCVIGRIKENTTLFAPDIPAVAEASARLQPTFQLTSNVNPVDIKAYVFFQVVGSAVFVRLRVTNLAPNTAHTLHIMQYGDVLSRDNGLGAGRDFVNPLNGGQSFMTSAAGTINAEFTDSTIALSGTKSIIGRTVVIADPMGARMAQGVVGINADGYTSVSSTGSVSYCPLNAAIIDPPTESSKNWTPLIVGLTVGLGVPLLLLFWYFCCYKTLPTFNKDQQYMKGDLNEPSMSTEPQPVEMRVVPHPPRTGGAPSAPGPANMPSTNQPGLPPNWTLYEDNEGNPYYYNSVTKESVWELPTH